MASAAGLALKPGLTSLRVSAASLPESNLAMWWREGCVSCCRLHVQCSAGGGDAPPRPGFAVSGWSEEAAAGNHLSECPAPAVLQGDGGNASGEDPSPGCTSMPRAHYTGGGSCADCGGCAEGSSS